MLSVDLSRSSTVKVRCGATLDKFWDILHQDRAFAITSHGYRRIACAYISTGLSRLVMTFDSCQFPCPLLYPALVV